MSVKRSTLTYGAIAVVVAIVIVGAAVAFNPSLFISSNQSSNSGSQSSTSGTLNIYLTDAPPSNPALKYVLVNVSSVELRYAGGVETSTSSSSSSITTTSSSSSSSTSTQPEGTYVFQVPSGVGKNINLTNLHGTSLLLGAPKVPAGQITSIILNITGARAFYVDKTSEQLKIAADGKLMVPLQFAVYSNGSTDLTLDVTPNMVHISQGDVLTPVIHATSVEHGPSNTVTTHSAEVDESSTTT